MRVVVDTNVLFEGMTKKAGACRLIINPWRMGWLKACISNALALEYEDVLARKLSAARWASLQPVLADLLNQSGRVKIYYTWRPSSPDPGDDLVIDCAMTADAAVVTANVRDFRLAQKELGLKVMTPVECVMALIKTF